MENVEKSFGYVKNCLIKPKSGDILFIETKDSVVPCLNGYAIVPLEEYNDLLKDIRQQASS